MNRDNCSLYPSLWLFMIGGDTVTKGGGGGGGITAHTHRPCRLCKFGCNISILTKNFDDNTLEEQIKLLNVKKLIWLHMAHKPEIKTRVSSNNCHLYLAHTCNKVDIAMTTEFKK